MVSVVLLLGSNDERAEKLVADAVAIIGHSVGSVVKCSAEYRSKA